MPWFPEFANAAELARLQTRAAGRADPVGEYFSALNKGDFRALETVWPIAVVTESPDDQSVVFRTYCSQWPVDGRRHIRPPILAGGSVHPDDIIGEYQTALSDGDADAILDTFGPDGYYCEPIGPQYAHRGTAELRSFFIRQFSAGGGIGLEYCTKTDDGVRCALEYNCVRWGLPRPSAPGWNRSLRAWPERTAGLGPPL